MTIPTEIEKDIKSGKARYQTFQTGVGGQSVLPALPNSYIIIFGYDYSPAGGGMTVQAGPLGAGGNTLVPAEIRAFETQQISFYTGQAFHPFIHHVNCMNSQVVNETDGTPQNLLVNSRPTYEMDTTPIERSVYIISNADVAITVGLIQLVDLQQSSAIPITNKTPANLTYGGAAAATQNIRTRLSPGTTPVDFLQPSLSQFDDYGIPGVPLDFRSDQIFANPDQVNGLIEPSQYLETTFGLNRREAAACNYFLNVHYALYTNQTPEQLG